MKQIQIAPGVFAFEANGKNERADNVPRDLFRNLNVKPEAIEIYERYRKSVEQEKNGSPKK